MLRSKKFIVITLLAIVVLVGSIGGMALAQTGDGDSSQPQTILDRVAEILGIDQQELEDAFAQARDETREARLQYLLDQGKITQEQIDEHEAWMESRPEGMFGPGWRGHDGFGMHRGGLGMHGSGFGGWCEEEAPLNS